MDLSLKSARIVCGVAACTVDPVELEHVTPLIFLLQIAFAMQTTTPEKNDVADPIY